MQRFLWLILLSQLRFYPPFYYTHNTNTDYFKTQYGETRISAAAEQLGVVIKHKASSLDPVSYTHLDVYKRQGRQ